MYPLLTRCLTSAVAYLVSSKRYVIIQQKTKVHLNRCSQTAAAARNACGLQKGSQDGDVTHEERVYGVLAMCCVMSLLSDVLVERCNNSAKGTSTLNPVLQGCHRSHKSFRSPGAPLYNRVIHEVEDMVRQWPVTQRWGVKTRMSPTMRLNC